MHRTAAAAVVGNREMQARLAARTRRVRQASSAAASAPGLLSALDLLPQQLTESSDC